MKVGDYVTLKRGRVMNNGEYVDASYILYLYEVSDKYDGCFRVKRGGPDGNIFDPNDAGNDHWGEQAFMLAEPPLRDVEILRYKI